MKGHTELRQWLSGQYATEGKLRVSRTVKRCIVHFVPVKIHTTSAKQEIVV